MIGYLEPQPFADHQVDVKLYLEHALERTTFKQVCRDRTAPQSGIGVALKLRKSVLLEEGDVAEICTSPAEARRCIVTTTLKDPAQVQQRPGDY